jgi:MinD-like ATPase involved in chromosome partitioning or flagellar assembly
MAVAAALWLTEFLPTPWGGLSRALAAGVGPVRIVGLIGGAVALWLTVTAALAIRLRELPPAPAVPLRLKPASLPPCRARRPVVTITSLEAGAGATTIAFNLAVLLATHGELRGGEDAGGAPVRPVCVLAEGRLTSALGLAPGPLGDLVANAHPLIPRLVELAVHHPTGCELLCLPAHLDSSRRLVNVVDQLRLHYDAVLVDGAFSLDAVLDVTAEFGELLLLVGLPSPAWVAPAGDWTDRVWAMRLERKAVVVVNRAGSGHAARDLTRGFLHVEQLPDDPAVADFDRLGLPWSLDARVPAARQLDRMARRMFPSFLTRAGIDAA